MMLERILAWIKRNDFADAWKQHQYQIMARAIADHVTGRSLVDVGCAEGLLTTILSNQTDIEASVVVGMDLVAHPLWSKVSSKAIFVAGDASHPPLMAGVTETVLAKDLLHHADDASSALRWLARLATKRVIIVEANAANPVMRMYTRHNGDKHFEDERLTQLLGEVVSLSAIRADEAVAYPFYLPPVRTLAALWVWPVTALMIMLFKILRLRAAAGILHNFAQRVRWQAPFMIRSFDVSDCHPDVR